MLTIMRRETSADLGGRKQVVTIRRVKQVLAIIRGETSAGHNEEGNKC